MSTETDPTTPALAGTKPSIEHILERIARGEYQNAIAAELGITPSALCQRLRNHPDHAIARELGLEHRLDQGLQRLEQAAQQLDEDVESGCDLNLARTREIQVRTSESVLRRLEWRASVEMPNRWGQRPNQVQVNAQGPVQVIVQDSWTEQKTEHNPESENPLGGPYDLLQDKSAEEGEG